MFLKIKGFAVNLLNVNHIEHDDGDVAVWFNGGGRILICDVNWKKLNRRLRKQGFSSLLPSTSKR